MRAALGLMVALGLGACGPTPISDPRQELLQDYGAWLLGRYAAAASAADGLSPALAALCAQPTDAHLSEARAAWAAARQPFKEAEVFAFGPYTEEPIRLGPKIDFWPARPESVAAVLVSSEPIAASTLGAQQRGFGALEVLLWPVEGDALSVMGDARRCDYLQALALDLAARLRELGQVWAPEGDNYLGELTEAGERRTLYSTLQMAFGEVINRVGYLLENLRADKLGRPWGLLSGGGPQPDKRESRFAGRTVDDLRDNVRGAQRLLLGDGQTPGLDGYLRARGRFIGPLLRPLFSAVAASLDALEQEPDAAERAQAVYDRLAELQRAVQVDVLSALSVTVGFNDNDGD